MKNIIWCIHVNVELGLCVTIQDVGAYVTIQDGDNPRCWSVCDNPRCWSMCDDPRCGDDTKCMITRGCACQLLHYYSFNKG